MLPSACRIWQLDERVRDGAGGCGHLWRRGDSGPGARQTASPWRVEIFEKPGRGVRRRIAIPFGADAVLSLVHVEDAARMLTLLATRAGVPSAVYDAPSENWRMRI
jgi:hypothetical protein